MIESACFWKSVIGVCVCVCFEIFTPSGATPDSLTIFPSASLKDNVVVAI